MSKLLSILGKLSEIYDWIYLHRSGMRKFIDPVMSSISDSTKPYSSLNIIHTMEQWNTNIKIAEAKSGENGEIKHYNKYI